MMSGRQFEPFNNRPLIGRTTEIIGGVLSAEQAIVVDLAESPNSYEVLYEQVVAELPNGSVASPLRAMKAVKAVVAKSVAYDLGITRAVLKSIQDERKLNRRLGVNDETPLSRFVEAGGGICHHQSLVGGVMLELLRDRRGLVGTTSLVQSWTETGLHSDIAHTTPGQRFFMDITNGLLAVHRTDLF